jgi:molybdopterin converting factor subunit 1
MKVNVRYFAALRDQRGLSSEAIESEKSNPADIYADLNTQFTFTLSDRQVRFAVNGEYVEADHELKEGDELVFIPPVAGG